MADIVDDPGWHDEIKRTMAERLADYGQRAEQTAKMAAPVDTGELRESIYSKMQGDDTVEIGATAHYALFVEEGHRIAYRSAEGEKVFTGGVVPPQPFLRPAMYGTKL